MYIFWGQNGLLGAKIAIIGPNILFFSRGTKSVGTNISENHWGHWGQNCTILTQKCWYWGTKVIFVLESQFLSGGISPHQYTRGYNFPVGPTLKKICFRDTARFLRLSSGPSVGSIPTSLFVSELEHSHRSRKSIFFCKYLPGPTVGSMHVYLI